MIDIIIPAYNCEETLERTLSSLVSQSDTDFCVTIVDDCSSQNIRTLVDKFTSLKIKYIRNEKNLGCGMSRQVGIDNTFCDYFTFLDSDDMFMPYTVELMNTSIKSNPDIIHGIIFEQTDSGLCMHSKFLTWCHGKCYKRSFVESYNIKNSPLVRWADDSYFNSMCFELASSVQYIQMPLVYYSYNAKSVTKKIDCERDKLQLCDFINAMIMSCRFVSEHKNTIDHIKSTLASVSRLVSNNETSNEIKELYNELLKYGGDN